MYGQQYDPQILHFQEPYSGVCGHVPTCISVLKTRLESVLPTEAIYSQPHNYHWLLVHEDMHELAYMLKRFTNYAFKTS